MTENFIEQHQIERSLYILIFLNNRVKKMYKFYKNYYLIDVSVSFMRNQTKWKIFIFFLLINY
jgi:hypothetical protein